MTLEVELGYGSLGKNKKPTNDRSPLYLGKIKFKQSVRQGDVGYLAAWLKKGDDGSNYFSLKLTEPRSDHVTRSAATHPRPGRDDDPLADDLPY